VQILVGMIFSWIAAHHYFAVRDDQLDANVIKVALMVVPMALLHHQCGRTDLPAETACGLCTAVQWVTRSCPRPTMLSSKHARTSEPVIDLDQRRPLVGRHTIVFNGREAMEKIYYVSFFKRLVDSNGRPATTCQGAVEVRAPDQDRAIELARQRFAELKDVADWSMRADYEMVELLVSRKRLSQRVRRHRTAKPLVAHQEFV
jgi:hypothetical protein